MESGEPRLSNTNVILASELFAQAEQYKSIVHDAGGTIWKTGSPRLDKELPQELWKGGRIITIGSIDPAGRGLSIDIIVHHLLEQHLYKANEDEQQDIFIVASPAQATASVALIYARLNARISTSDLPRKPGMTRYHDRPEQFDAKKLLNSVSLLQYLDIAGLIESVHEVASTLRQHRDTKPRRCILLIQGIGSVMTAMTARTRGLIQPAAMLETVLQAVRDITRSNHGLCLCLMELNIQWERPNWSVRANYAPPLNSAFKSRFGNKLKMKVNGVLCKILLRHLDVLVLVHDGDKRINTQWQNRRIVEVSKDSTGTLPRRKRTANWSIWR